MKVSHIICSRNRATQLEFALSKLNPEALVRHNVELVLVDNASDDTTMTVMETYAKQSPAVTRVVQADELGRSIALNVGVRASCGDLLIFTDDDCYLEENYYEAILKDFDPAQHQYGTGQVLLFDHPMTDASQFVPSLRNMSSRHSHFYLPARSKAPICFFCDAYSNVLDTFARFSAQVLCLRAPAILNFQRAHLWLGSAASCCLA